jgi:hypothetical protein
VAEVERARGIFHYGEMQRFDADGGRVGAVVAGGEELSAPEADLDICCRRGEY